jgi:hypothetical protein
MMAFVLWYVTTYMSATEEVVINNPAMAIALVTAVRRLEIGLMIAPA